VPTIGEVIATVLALIASSAAPALGGSAAGAGAGLTAPSTAGERAAGLRLLKWRHQLRCSHFKSLCYQGLFFFNRYALVAKLDSELSDIGGPDDAEQFFDLLKIDLHFVSSN